jgi:ADP-ribose pyrophosphatase YjhB (NUDIX family)
MHFSTANELRAFLKVCNIDTTSWGSGKARSLEDLMIELSLGESELKQEGYRVVRHVHVVVGLIPRSTKHKNFLKVKQQELPDGRFRSRDNFPGGKKNANELPEEAMTRELKEELGWEVMWEHLVLLGKEDKTEASASYPGLTSLYTKWYFLAPPGRHLPTSTFQHACEEGGCQLFTWINRDELTLPEEIILPGS